MKKLGVIIPIFNAALYLNDLLLDISKNDYEDVEIVFVIDGATDRSKEICLEYQRIDKRCKVIVSEKRLGVSISRNRGIMALTREVEYIGFIDADDRISPTYFSRFALEASKHPDSDIIIGEIECKIGNKIFFPFSTGEYTKESNLISGFLQFSFSSTVWGRFYKTNVIKDILFKNISILEDFWFNWRAIKNVSKLLVTDGPRYSYIIRDEMSLSKQFSLDCLSVMPFGDEIISDLYMNGDDSLVEDGKSFVAALLIHILAMYLASTINKDNNEHIGELLEYAERFRNVIVNNYLVDSDRGLLLSELIVKSHKKRNDFIIVGIAGRGATGKSYLSKYLQKKLGVGCQYIEVDKIVEKYVLPSAELLEKTSQRFNRKITIDDIVGSYFCFDEESKAIHECFCEYVNKKVIEQIDTTKNVIIIDWFLYHELELFKYSDFSIFLDVAEHMRQERCCLRGSDLEMYKKVDLAYKLPKSDDIYTKIYNSEKTTCEAIYLDIVDFQTRSAL